MADKITTLDDALSDSIDSASCSKEGFEQLAKILEAIEHVAGLTCSPHLQTIAQAGIETAERAYSDHRRFENARGEVLHG
ncbi:hypothetical protein [Burkholderia cenocepacia]|jgi:hypothetical protein|uniref:Uncharacterized protein n=1 Tax=Burkholderia cenocepacia (strain ATCC BAA-245 / DSM 16553 / LMG 16656 / NCTC 13227 / J2315 / CF5610) TaxID=216591 RepID=B4EB59_BURCJ|nr:hypothetical protein [Burkholderia cenocepacia]KIS48715.1 hypothetical protein NP88_6979 [Burkholderia cepacia]ERI31677.1 hypothetical protein BURCENBC7_AP5871 [Burkholderia cenocepacia BC7]KKI79820.1 hypothetical protein WQ49_35155 [Burkholderia cenocepacia]ONR55491.1 hypothetical protein A8E17_23960 [Burkholderia cenocepacia]ONR64743.1 hypothetical protein A8E18_28845 [Burkholderia cenocepacia]